MKSNWALAISCLLVPTLIGAEGYDVLVRRYERQINQQEKQLETLRSRLLVKEKESQRWQQKAEESRQQWNQAGAAVERTRSVVQGVRDKLIKTRALANAAESSATERGFEARATDTQLTQLARRAYVDRLVGETEPVTVQDSASSFVLASLSGASVNVHALAEAARRQEIALRSEQLRVQSLEQQQTAELDRLHSQQQALYEKWQEANHRRAVLEQEKNQMEQSAQALRVLVQELRDHRDHAKASVQGKPVTDDKALAALRGSLPWPADGQVVQNFGRQYSAELQQLLVSNGIRIESGASHNVRAVQAGKVLFASPFREYGQLVIVRHVGGLTSVYGSLGDLKVKEGDQLGALDVIGTTNESGAFYFELRHEEQPINPLVYLAPSRHRSDVSLRRKFK